VSTVHRPVLLDEVIDVLRPRPGGIYIDGTLGGAGHAEAILEASAPSGKLLGLDLDPAAIERARERLARFGDRVLLVHASFADLERTARWERFAPADGIVLDLGLSSDQLESSERGFGFRVAAPLDMRFNPHGSGPSARELVRRLDVDELAQIFRDFGEDPQAKRIARAIVAERARRPIELTTDLAAVVEKVVPRHGKTHPATRVFQALRIAVNRELDALASALPQAIDILGPGGRLAIISFHSLEDRVVKRFFVEQAATCVCPPGLPVCVCGRTPTVRIVTRHGIRPSPQEVADNPRSRSAMLRAVERLSEPRPTLGAGAEA
jgi:16S rRNA (cytosine1402-N4)-methyltransferase